MRIILEKEKQKELIEKAKSNLTWEELGKVLAINPHYLSVELRNRKTYLSEEIYKKLCNQTNINFDKFIRKVGDNWGQIKGASLTSRNTKTFEPPNENIELAEMFGIILGDGHVEEIKIGKRIRCYSITIVGDSLNDKEYLINHISKLYKDLFKEGGKISYQKNKRAMAIKIHGKKIIEFIKNKGISPGNKKDNNQGIPTWIKNNNEYLKACIRGLMDTDGSIHYIARNNKNIRLSFTSHIPKLLNDFRESLLKLGFEPSKIIRERQLFISNKRGISKYIQEIGFKNQKHLKRLENLQRLMLP